MFAASNSLDEKQGMSFSPAAAEPAPSDGASQGDFLIPANLPVSPTPPKAGSPAPGAAKRKARAHHALSPGTGGLDQYFEEQEQQSREVDHSSTTSNKAVAPPPKSGGPPKAQSPAPPAA